MSEAPTKIAVSSSRLWFGMLGGAVAWFVHFLGSSVTAEWGCLGGIDRWQWLGVTSVAWMIIGWTAFSLLFATFATWVAYGNHRLLNENVATTDENGKNQSTNRFLAVTGLLTSGLFVFIILAQSIPILFFLTEC